uniref:Neur_chan_LBD domain-containing protein n=1 Tax=Macrostomum lignano TaxID=282301 RepID=A0A1I8JRP2_9PLAT
LAGQWEPSRPRCSAAPPRGDSPAAFCSNSARDPSIAASPSLLRTKRAERLYASPRGLILQRPNPEPWASGVRATASRSLFGGRDQQSRMGRLGARDRARQKPLASVLRRRAIARQQKPLGLRLEAARDRASREAASLRLRPPAIAAGRKPASLHLKARDRARDRRQQKPLAISSLRRPRSRQAEAASLRLRRPEMARSAAAPGSVGRSAGLGARLRTAAPHTNYTNIVDRIVFHIFRGYNKHQRPVPASRQKPDGTIEEDSTDVDVNMKILSINKVDVINMEFTLDMYCFWKDTRLRWDHYKDFSFYNESIAIPAKKEHLLPDLFFRNGKEDVLREHRLRYGYTTRNLLFKWKRDGLKDPISNAPDFAESHDCTQGSATSTGSYACLKAIFKLERQLGSYLSHPRHPHRGGLLAQLLDHEGRVYFVEALVFGNAGFDLRSLQISGHLLRIRLI